MSNNETGKVYVKGKALEKCTCDRMTIKIEFYGIGNSGAKASETALAQCERFLERMEMIGADISMIRLQDDSIDKPSYRDDGKIKATRKIKFDSEAKAEINNCVLKIIQEEHLDADFSTDYYLSNEDEIRKELKRMAVLNSRENAELMASAAGKEIVGVDTIDMTGNQVRERRTKSISMDDDRDCIFSIFSKKLSMPTKDIEEEVEATWLIK